ncbi:hypothetical protein INT45_008443 [Circinella minor]|uniref:Uncharacterized protein n=1 Tax=Circinella minor TaxID=1195481 RepID=A0A8H7VU57_9FUNG|nr:hypothetical protein INT45_008443 [Circinella minor]
MAIARFKVQREATDSLDAAVRLMKETRDDLVHDDDNILTGETLTDDETKILSDITNDDYLDNVIIRLSLSRIVNLIEPKLKQYILPHLDNTEKERLQNTFTTFFSSSVGRRNSKIFIIY